MTSNRIKVFALGFCLALACLATSGCAIPEKHQTNTTQADNALAGKRILLFSKTLGWRHQSIPNGIEMFDQLSDQHSFSVVATEDAAIFSDEGLSDFDVIVFMNTTGDVLNDDQQGAMERFIRSGKGFLGIHSATDTEKENWPWYNDLVGGIFAAHPNNPNVREGDLTTINDNHPASKGLPKTFSISDEFYDFRYLNPKTDVLVTIDDSSYDWTSPHGDFHPMVWYHDYDGGRAFYTALGHAKETYDNPLFRQMVVGGLIYVGGAAQ